MVDPFPCWSRRAKFGVVRKNRRKPEQFRLLCRSHRPVASFRPLSNFLTSRQLLVSPVAIGSRFGFLLLDTLSNIGFCCLHRSFGNFYRCGLGSPEKLFWITVANFDRSPANI